MIIGSHVQMKAPLYLLGSAQEAVSYGANAFMIYTGAPQNTVRKPIADFHVDEAKQYMIEHGIDIKNLIIHAPYIINPANSVKPEVKELAVEFLQKECERTKEIGASILVLHPGSFTTTDLETGIQTIIEQLNHVTVPEGVTIALETMAGKGSEVGYAFEQLAQIRKGLKQANQYGVCLDTCHIHDAGYDLSKFDEILDEFDQRIGLEHLKVVHLNDSKNERGAHKDRHANIGEGCIGFEILHGIAHHPRLEMIPKILETPYIEGHPPYKEEIAALIQP